MKFIKYIVATAGMYLMNFMYFKTCRNVGEKNAER